MNWKIFTIVSINVAAIFLPYNIIGCAGGELDPHDYFVSFFDKNLSRDKSLQPFYYTNFEFLYESGDNNDSSSIPERTSAEWISYAGSKVTKNDAYEFICKSDLAALNGVYNHIEKSAPLPSGKAFTANTLFDYFKTSRDLEGLGYLLYAKKLEPHVTGSWSSWEPIERDSLAMAKLIKNGQQLYAAAKTDFIKSRYAYQLVRLAHYSRRYRECIEWYDQLIKPYKLPPVLNELSVSLKAGALLRIGKKNEAAYEFSKLFSARHYHRIGDYMSFDWSVSRFDESNRKACLSFCKTDAEKADLLSLFALGSNQEELATLQQVYQFNPQSGTLELLVIREIHKLEEYYFGPSLKFSAGDKKTGRGYEQIDINDPLFKKFKTESSGLAALCKKIGSDKSVTNASLFTLAAAHASMIGRNYKEAQSLLSELGKKKLNTELNDQTRMTGILLMINSKDSINASFEEQLLPSVKWLSTKAKQNKEYAKFYRRLFADILANKYRSDTGKDKVKNLLCIGVADKIAASTEDGGWGYYSTALNTLRNSTPAEEVEQLIGLIENKNLNSFEKFLVTNSEFTRDDLNDIAGTTWLRKFDFVKAEKWFQKVSPSYFEKDLFKVFLAANPFADLLLDTHAATPQDTVMYTKLSFTRKMLTLQKETQTSATADHKAKAFYQLATGLYNMSYWGNSWLLVKYDWSGGETASSSNDVYFNLTRARDNYLKAATAFTDRNKKARAIFMAAKCDQKQIGGFPELYSYKDTKEYNTAVRKWINAFDKRNGYFTTLKKEYGNTAFFTEAETACSYLSEFVRKDRK